MISISNILVLSAGSIYNQKIVVVILLLFKSKLLVVLAVFPVDQDSAVEGKLV